VTHVDLLFIVAAHNRRMLTTAAAQAALSSAHSAGKSAYVVVFDDGSTDGTGEALAALSNVTVVAGDGTSFWARGMAAAEEAALSLFDSFHYLVWLNDDVDLDADFVERALEAAPEDPGVLICSTRDPISHEATYGGLKRAGAHPLSFDLIEPTASNQKAQAMNGNLVFVSTTARARIGAIDGRFSHGFADIDYGVRCSRSQVKLEVAPGTFGACARNPVRTYDNRLDAWRVFVSERGGGHLSSLARMLRKLRPRTWVLWLAATYVRWWQRHALPQSTYPST